MTNRSSTNIPSSERSSAPSSEATPTFGRYAEIPYDKMTPQQQEGYRALALVEGDGSPNLPGPLKIWVNNPALSLAIAPLATHFRPPHHSLTQREREIAVCVLIGKWHAPYSINAHAEVIQGLGLSAEVTEALLGGRPTSFPDESEQMIYEIAVTVATSRWVPRSLHDRAVQTLGHERIADVLVLMGFYTAISFTLNFYDVPAGTPGMQR
jgi:4-carboxymuconolactone decarboxylase